MAMRNRVCTIRTVFLFGSALASLILGDSGLAFGSTGCDLVNAVGPIASGTIVTSGVGKFEAGDTVKFLLPSPGLNGGLAFSQVDAAALNFIGQRQTPTEFVFVFDKAVDGVSWRFQNHSVGVATASCEPG